MPLIVVTFASFLVGLLAGFGGLAAVWAAGCVIAGAGAALKRRFDLCAILAIALAGAVTANLARSDDARCARDMARRLPVTVRLDEAAGPGAYVSARVVACAGKVRIAVERGRAPMGATVAVDGTIAPASDRVIVQRATITERAAPGWLTRWRDAAGRAIDSTFAGDAPLARALLVADTKGLPPDLRDRFAAAGLAHMLSISGLHVGIIAVALELVLQLLQLSRRPASLVTLAVIALYVAVIGAPPPAVRSAVMLSLNTLSRTIQRPTSPWAILALGAVQPLFDPRVILDLGYQLSVVGVAALIAGGRFVKRLNLHALPRWSRSLASAAIVTTIATIGSAPLVAWVFGRVSIIAPLSNLIASPLIGLAQPMLFGGMLFAHVGGVGRLFADAAHPLLSAIDRVAATSAGIPGASIQIAPSAMSAAISAVAAIAVLTACASSDPRRPATLALTAIVALVWLPLAPVRAGLTELHMIDVGQGDAIALRTPHGHWILFDAGRAWSGGDAGRSTLVPYIGRRGGTVDAFVLSHPHTDHVGGATSIIRMLHPVRYFDSGFPGGADAYRASLTAAQQAHVQWTRARPLDSLVVDGVTVTFLAPDSNWTAGLADPNLASVVSLVRVGEVRMLLMGDAERPEEDWLLEHERELLRADVLKVAHHGSATSSTEAFLEAVQPRLALVSVGAGNTYGHPNQGVMQSLAAWGAQVLRTDRVGTIVVRTDGRRLYVDAGGDRWELPDSSTR